MRLDKFISSSTDFSRTQIRRAAKAGKIQINGARATNGAQTVAEGDEVTLEGIVIQQPGPRYFMLYKPKGYVCATKDSEHGIVIDLLDEPNSEQLQIVGRLDIDTTGLVLITDDGQWNHRITSPRRRCEKIYHVSCAKPIESSYIEAFKEGVQLESESSPSLPANLEVWGENTRASLSLYEGKYHQVKRMFAALGNHVDALHRHSIGSITLDPTLAEGEYRPLNQAEIDSI